MYITEKITKPLKMGNTDLSTIGTWGNDLNHNFIRLNRNYQDYTHDLNSVKTEEKR